MDYLTDKVVAVTGSSGFIGKSLVNALTGSVDQLILVVRNVNQKTVHKQIEFDLVSTDIPQDFFSGVDYIFHLAGCAHDTNRIIDKDYYYKINVEATVNLAKFAIKNKVKKFIFLSSVKAGGNLMDSSCMSEYDQSEPEGIYGRTKREAELQVLRRGRQSGMHISIIRSALVYGPSMKGNLYDMFSGIKKGWFPPLPETGNRRSMIHVDDVVQAILLLASDQRSNDEIFIVTDGKTYSSRDIYEIMCSTLDKRIPRWSVPQFLFNVIASISSHLQYRIDKLLGDECYSSKKIQSIGFKAKKTLKDMHETDY